MKAMIIVFAVLLSLAIAVRVLPRFSQLAPIVTPLSTAAPAPTLPASPLGSAPMARGGSQPPISHILNAEFPPERALPIIPEFKNMHRYYAARFSDVMGFGSERMSSIVDFHSIVEDKMKTENEIFHITKVELMGLAKQCPVIYTATPLPASAPSSESETKFEVEAVSQLKEKPHIPSWVRNPATRPMDEFERVAVKRMKNGQDLFARNTENGVQVIGALRAEMNCAKCHDTAQGTLLGALVYSVVSRPVIAE